MFQQPIFVYSQFCNHSTNFLRELTKHPTIGDAFAYLNIDVDPQTGHRPHEFFSVQSALQHPITEVPTIILQNGEYVLSGEEAFKWLDYQISSINETVEEELEPFNPNEMGSFSDGYSEFGVNELYAAKSQCFKFVNDPDQHIETPQEKGSVSTDDYKRKQKERESLDLMAATPQPKTIGTSYFKQNQNPNQNRSVSDKQKDMDARLKQLMSERESFTPSIQQQTQQKIDFKTGKIIC